MSHGMSVVPPSSSKSKRDTGFDFIQDGLLFADTDIEGVINQLVDYRAANSLPIGNPRQEILDYNDSKTKNVVPVKIVPQLRERVVRWLESRLRLKPKYVDEQEANRRAAICYSCPRNNQGWQKGEKCNQCVENSLRARAVILMGRKQHQLGACETLGHDITSAVWLNEPKSEEELPSFCWRLKNFDT